MPPSTDLAWDHAMDISGSVYTRLKELKMTQSELAKRMGVTPGRITQIFKDNPGNDPQNSGASGECTRHEAGQRLQVRQSQEGNVALKMQPF